MKKKWIWITVAAFVVVTAVFLTVKGIYERERPVVVENILLRRYTDWDYENQVVEEVPLRLELTGRKTLFRSEVKISGTAFFGADITLPDTLPEDIRMLSSEVNALLRGGVTLSAYSDNGFLYGRANPDSFHLNGMILNLPAGAYPPKLRMNLEISVLAPDYNIIYGETLYDQVTLNLATDEGTAEWTSHINRYLCDLTPLRSALAAACD